MTGQPRILGAIALFSALAASGCAGGNAPTRIKATLPTVSVPAQAETMPVATPNADAADDPAIFARADSAPFDFAGQPHPAIILGTDKKAGLYVFALGGGALQFLPDGLLNNVDLRRTGDGFIAGASDRGRMGIALYRFSGSGTLAPAGFIKSDVIEPYGFCMGRIAGQLVAVLIAKDGQTRVYALDEGASTITGTEIRRFAIGSQSEGCAVDDATGDLYAGEELKGVWRYSLARPDAPREAIAMVGEGALVPDVEGVTIMADGADKFLIVSSQGDSAYAVWRLVPGGRPAYVGRFGIAASGGVDAVTGTDGIDAMGGAVGDYPAGLFVAQDDVNTGGPQNFKLVDWRAIKAAIKL